MLIEKPEFYICPEFIIRQAYRPWEVAGSNQLRHDTFVNEQGIFEGNDRDEIDRDMITIVAVSTLASEEDEVVGTVRIHQPARRRRRRRRQRRRRAQSYFVATRPWQGAVARRGGMDF